MSTSPKVIYHVYSYVLWFLDTFLHKQTVLTTNYGTHLQQKCTSALRYTIWHKHKSSKQKIVYNFPAVPMAPLSQMSYVYIRVCDIERHFFVLLLDTGARMICLFVGSWCPSKLHICKCTRHAAHISWPRTQTATTFCIYHVIASALAATACVEFVCLVFVWFAYASNANKRNAIYMYTLSRKSAPPPTSDKVTLRGVRRTDWCAPFKIIAPRDNSSIIEHSRRDTHIQSRTNKPLNDAWHTFAAARCFR